ncbi:MAG: flagellar biosynthetic protein FliO [Thermodesulfobacteriota bacterium]
MLGFGQWAGLERLGVLLAAAPLAGSPLATPAPEFPFWQHLFKVMAVLSGMLGVLVLVLYLWKRVGASARVSTPFIKVLATHYLAPKKALIMVAVGKERFLLASTAEQLTLVTPLAPDNVGAPGEAAPMSSKEALGSGGEGNP